MLRIFISFLLLCFSFNQAFAKYCVKLPSCEELGYKFKYNENRRQIRCPFDMQKVLYLDFCQAYGITGKPDEDAGVAQQCIEKDFDGRNIETNFYRYTRCNKGYTYKSGFCEASACEGFNDVSGEGCAASEQCNRGNKLVYKCTECFEGFKYIEEKKQCEKECLYTETKQPDNCNTFDSCKLKGSTFYASVCEECIDKYTSFGGVCGKSCSTDSLGDCSIGTIFTHNGAAIGVVFFKETDGSAIKILALSNVDKEGNENNSARMYWSAEASNDYTYKYKLGTTDDDNGEGNTDKILAYIKTNNAIAEAATATRSYAPAGCESGSICAQGEWYLPAIKELDTIQQNITAINSAMEKIKDRNSNKIADVSYWSSSEYTGDDKKAWRFSNQIIDEGTFLVASMYTVKQYVRPVLAISK